MFKRNFRPIKLLNCFLLVILTVSLLVSFSSLEVASAAPTALSRKWAGYVAGGGEALLTADVRSDIAGEEVFHAGGPVAPNSGGRVTCLNGRTGAQIWTRRITNVGDTCQIHMTDMDNNGDLEIIVPLQQPAGVYILHAENGNTMFSATSLGGGRIDSSPVSGDVDRDGYPDMFIGVMGYEEVEPINGKVIRYEWNPSTNSIVERDRVTVWHPCAGGLSLCDTDNDGRIELYMNERDVYFGDGSWGRGIVSFWADTLDVRWQIYDWGASSNIPMLTDVNKDGVIDVVCTDLSAGVCVLNSTDGTPLKNSAGTILYQTRIPGRHNHYQSSVYDIDGDGNIEVLSGDGFEGDFDFITVFDLWRWTLDASIDTTQVGGRSWKGPTVGEVTGDGQMDIVVVTFDHISNSDNGTIQVYDRNYNLVYVNTGLRHRAIESVVQDVDRNDGGLNELLVLTQGGVIYCFETPGIASKSRARSEIQFYSESRRGASEYLAFERPVTSPPPVNPNPPANTAPTQSTPAISGASDSDNLVVTPQGTYDADGDKVTNIYNWQKGGVSLASINLPFETQTAMQDEYSGLATTRDYANSASGSVFGATWTPNGKVGGAYSFNGNDFIRVEESNNRYDGGGSWSQMSVECWVKVGSTSNERLILKTDRYETRIISYRLDCRNLGNQLLFSWNASGRTPVLYGSTTSGVNDWHHIVCTYKSGVGSRIYIDGILANSSLSASYTGNIINTGGPFEIAFGSGSDFIGLVDEVRLYNFEVSAAMATQRFSDTRNGLSSISIISSDDTKVGDQWRCQVTPNDGKTDGSTLSTVTRTIVEGGTGYSLTVNTVGSGSVTKNPNQSTYSSGTIVTLTATPASGYIFSGWGGALTGNTNPAQITMDSNKIVTATFVPVSSEHWFADGFETGNLALWDGSDGSASVSTANPHQGTYHLRGTLGSGANNGWSGAYKSVAGMNPLYLKAYVYFNAPPNTDNEDQWALCFSQSTAGNALAYAGVRRVSGTLYWAIWYISSGSTLTYSLGSPYTSGWHNLELAVSRGISNDGWVELYVDGVKTCSAYNLDQDARALNYARVGFSYSDAPSAASSTVYIDDVTIDATTTPTPTEYSLTTGVVGSGSVTKNPNQALYASGTVVTLTAVPAVGWSFNGWSGDLTGNTNPTTITMTSNKVVTATFTQNQPSTYTLTINVIGSGSVIKNPNQSTYTSGTIVALTAVPASGYVFSGWSGSLSGNTNPTSITMDSNKVVTATFTASPGTHVFADGFESGSFSAWTSTTTTTGGTAIVSTSPVHSGSYSGRFAISSGTGTRRAYSYVNVGSLSEARASAYIYLPSGLSLSSGQSLWLIQFADSSGSVLASYGIRADASGLRWGVQSGNWPYAVGSAVPSGGGWYLLEAYFTHAASGPTLVLSVNNVDVASLIQNTSTANNIATVRLGVCYYVGSPAITVYADDVTADSE